MGADADADETRARIDARLAEIDGAEAAVAADADAVTLDQQKVGRLSRMDAMQQNAMAGATAARRAREKRRLRQALARLDGGQYGLCLRCDEDIAPARLAIDPAAEYCIGCAALAD